MQNLYLLYINLKEKNMRKIAIYGKGGMMTILFTNIKMANFLRNLIILCKPIKMSMKLMAKE